MFEGEKISLTEAIARIEGFGASPLNRSTRNNNPGDIEWGDFARAHGASRLENTPFHVQARFAYFPTIAQGYAALRALLKEHYHGYSVTSLIMHYAPPNENDTEHYIRLACKMVGCQPNDPIDKFI